MEALIAWSKSFGAESSENAKKSAGKQRKASSAKGSKGFG